MKPTWIMLGLFAPVLILAMPSYSAPVHQHGVAEASVVVEGKEVSISFRLPLMDILGTESAPATDSDRKRYAQGLQQVTTPQLPDTAQCQLLSTQRSTVDSLFPQRHAHHEHQHDHGHDHDHDHDHDHHADFEAHWTFTCNKPDALKQVEFPWLNNFRSLRTEVVLLLPKGQTAVRLSQGQTRLTLHH